MFAVAHMGVFEISGPHATEFLDLVVTNYARWFEPGESYYNYFLDPDGIEVELVEYDADLLPGRQVRVRADAGGADLAGRRKMIGALKALQRQSEPQDLPGEFAAFGISGGMGDGLKRLFMSHPPLQERIAALEERA
mgnify:CR=1 FL=1